MSFSARILQHALHFHDGTQRLHRNRLFKIPSALKICKVENSSGEIPQKSFGRGLGNLRTKIARHLSHPLSRREGDTTVFPPRLLQHKRSRASRIHTRDGGYDSTASSTSSIADLLREKESTMVMVVLMQHRPFLATTPRIPSFELVCRPRLASPTNDLHMEVDI